MVEGRRGKIPLKKAVDLKLVHKRKDLSETVDCTFSPHNKPVMKVSPGETVKIETYDCFADAVRPGKELDKILGSGTPIYDNPVTGPIYIKGAEKGDVLKVEVIDIQVPDLGVTTIVPGFGALEGWLTKMPATTKFTNIRNNAIYYKTDHGKEVQLPLKPFIGTIGVSPPTESISTITPHKHGGNMDVADICPGNTLYLPIGVKGALFAAGDVHAAQGDGEICGTAVEVPATITLRFTILKGRTIEWPRIESQEEIMAVGSARPLEDAARLAFRELIDWMRSDYGFSTYDAYMLLSIAGKARIAQIVDPLYTVVAKISKKHLE
ncbi:MAG: acetamidase/formamidase family protein [Candidatus Bathyarchaeia archaeon]